MTRRLHQLLENIYGRNSSENLLTKFNCKHLPTSYAAFLYSGSCQRDSYETPRASAMALRSLRDLLLPFITWYIAVRSTPLLRAISAPDIPFLSSSIFIFVAVVIMM